MKMNEIFQPNPDVGMELEIQNSLEKRSGELKGLESEIGITGTESKKESFGGIRLSYNGKYTVDGINETVQNNKKYKRYPFNEVDYADCRLDIRLPKKDKKGNVIKDEKGNVVYTKKGALGKIVYGNAKVEGKSKPEPHIETYYSEKKLPGGGLNIPGRHVAEDGTIRDKDGYICVATKNYVPKGKRIMTTLGPAKVYDAGDNRMDNKPRVDIYTSW